MKTYFILDGYSLIYKSYFAFIRNPMMNPQGENSSAIFGFFRTLFSLFDRYKPDYFLVTLDSLTPTFRHQMYPEYKATRDKTPEDLHAQIPRIEAILKALGIAAVRVNGYEADDIIATYAKKCQESGCQCRIITGDKDLLQLVSDNIKVIRYSKDDYNEMNRDGVFAEWGVWPEQILDYLSLCGDSADNIPGVRGIGPKGAVNLLQTYGNIDNIYQNLQNIKGANKAKLEASREDCLLSRRLVQLCTDVPLEHNLEDFSTASLDYQAAIPLLKKEGIKSVIKWLEDKVGAQAGDLFAQIQDDGPAKPETKKGTYTAITTIAQLEPLIEEVKKAGLYAFDSETDSLDFVTNVPVGFSIAIRAEEGFYIPLKAEGQTFIPEETVKSKLRQILEDPTLKLVGQNFKFDYQVLKRWGINPANIWFDTMVAAWLVDTRISTYNMDYLADHYFGYKTITYDEVVPKGKSFQDVPLGQATEYAAEDADITFRLYQHLLPLVQKANEKLFFDVEMPLVTILGDMELEGIRIDRHVLEKYAVELDSQLAGIEKEIYRECGREFNINSTQQLQEVLFTDRKLKPIKKTKTGYSTDTSVLEELALEDVVPQLILKYRSLAKLKSTYVDALPQLTDSSSRLHTTFRQTGTATGRLSSTNPNLQNIPIRDEEGRRIRKAFIAREGMVFLSADYSQIELVVLAHLSQDPELTKAFNNGVDVHRLTASLVFGIPQETVTPEQRRIAKVINFGVIYGMSAFRLSRELNIPVQQASGFIKMYFEKYAGVQNFISQTLEYARQHESVKTILGRERYINGINSKNHNEKSGAERMAFNSPIQGSAADIVKMAMINISRRLKEKGLESKMVLQIHDELIFEVPLKEVETMKALVKEEMENVIKLHIPLRVSIETAESWGDMH